MKRVHWYYIGWAIFMVGMIMRNPPWEQGWLNVWIGLGVGVAIAILSHVSERFGRDLDIGEARFDSETGKQLPAYKDEK